MKKIHLFQIISVTTLILLGGPLAKAVSFNDVPAGHPNADAIEYVKENGIVSGYPDGTFKPDNTINRAEFTKIIIGAQFDSATIENCITQNVQASWTYAFFPDVPKDAWFAKYICAAKMKGIINGYPDGLFKPESDINFSEASKIIVNAFGYTVGSDAVWYKPFVDQLGLKMAIPTTIASFSANITRGEMAEMVYRLKANVMTKASLDYGTIGAAETELLTYKNDAYGFEFQYPKEWKIDQERTSANEVVFDIGLPESREAVAFAKNTQDKTLEQLKADQVPDASVIDKQSEITIGGENALVIETTEMGRTLILFNHGANTYTITTGGRRMIDEGVTSTFKFTD